MEATMEEKRCLVCYKQIAFSTDYQCTKRERNQTLIDKQLDGIFVLNELLRIPLSSLANYLEMFPDKNPDSWTTLCGECDKMAGEGRRIFREIMEAKRRFKVLQEQVVSKLKNSTMGLETVQGSKKKKRIERDVWELVTEDSRQFVKNYDYGHFGDPLADGDLEAYRRLCNKTAEIEIEEGMIKQEVCDDNPPTPEGEQSRSGDPDYVDEGTCWEDSSEDDWEPPSTKIKLETLDQDVKTEETEGSVEEPGDAKPRKKKGRLIDVEGAFYRKDGKVSFRCSIEGCSAVYKNKNHFQRHKLRHSGNLPQFRCDQCNKVLASEQGLFTHKKIIHENDARFSCKETKRKYLARLQTKCPHCDHVTNRFSLASHIKVVHEKVHKLYCEKCGKGQSNQRDIRWHQAKVHGICSVEECKQAFPGERERLRNHQLEVHGKEIDMFACDECGTLFTRVDLLERHKRGHEKKRRKQKMKEEARNKVGGGEGWVCHKCGKKYELKEGLRIHIGWHRRVAKREMERSKANADGQNSAK